MNIKKYFHDEFSSDLKAGFITAIVALPLAIAFAIASGVSPIMGLYTAIIAGILAGLSGGSAFSITGPTGAMSIIILATTNRFGLEGLLVAGFIAGVIQVVLGVIKLGKFVKFIPLPIVSGFTAGIGALIFIGQIPNFLGLVLPAKEHIWETIIAIMENIGSANLIAVGIAVFTLLCMIYLPSVLLKVRLSIIPASMFALLITTIGAYVLGLSIPLVGEIPSGLPQFSFFKINLELVRNVLPAAFTIALLGAIESLLCAVVCDGMTGTKHKSNKELVAQGATNMVLPFFGGMPATAAIARSAVNVREGAKTRMAGVYHAIILLLIVLFFASVAMFIPKAFLAGILMYVSFRMINFREFRTILKISIAEGIVLFITFGLTLFTDLVFAVQMGMLLAILLLFIRFSNLIEFEDYSKQGSKSELLAKINAHPKMKKQVGLYTLAGPFFFGAMSLFDSKIEEHMKIKRKYIIIRMRHVPFIDSSGIARLTDFVKDRNKHGCTVFFATLQPEVLRILIADEEFHKLMSKNKTFETSEEAVEYIEKHYFSSLALRN